MVSKEMKTIARIEDQLSSLSHRGLVWLKDSLDCEMERRGEKPSKDEFSKD